MISNPRANTRAAELFGVFLLSLAAGPASGGTNVTPLEIGVPLPALRGERLDGRPSVLPDSSLGTAFVLLLGFSYESRHDVEAWAARYRADFGPRPAIACFEVPVIGGAARLARPFIDRGMRRGTPRELHDRVITVYRDAGEWKRRLRFTAPDVAYVLLIDRAGRVAWRTQGPLGDAVYGELATLIRALGSEGAPERANPPDNAAPR